MLLRFRARPLQMLMRAAPPSSASCHQSNSTRSGRSGPIESGLPLSRPASEDSGAIPRVEWFSDSYMLSDRISHLVFQKENRIDAIKDLLNRHTGIMNTHGADVYGRLISSYARKPSMRDAPRQFWEEMRARNIQPSPQTYTTMITVYESQMGRGFASESVIRDRLKRIEELKHELMDKKLLSRAHANAILNACIASSSFGGFELGMKIYEMLQTNFANLKRKAIENSSNKSSGLDDKLPVDMIVKNLSSAENSPPIPDMVTYSLMVRFLTKCKRSDLVKTVTQIDFVNSALIPDESFICSLLRHYLPLPGEENRALLLGYAASAFRLPILAEHIAGRHRRVLFQNRLYRILQKNAHSLVLTSKSLDILLRTTMKIPGRSVKLDVIKVLMERRALDEDTVDDAVARLVLGMHLKCSDYVGAQAFADFVLTFDEVKSDKSIGIYDDLISTMAVHLAQDNSLDSKFAPNYRELCNKLISICEQKRLIPSESSSAVDRVDISGLLQNPRLCLLRFLTNIQKFVVQCKALDKKDALSSEGFGKIFFVGLYFAEQYVPLCLEVVANQAGGADSWAFVDFLETSKEMLNLGQKLPEVSKNAKKFKFLKTGDPMQKRILKWGRMESDIEWVLQNRN